MRTTASIDPDWPALLSKLERVIDLGATARTTRALVRRRGVGDAETLLRLALAYGPGGMSLRSAAAWAGLNGVAAISDVALLKRLRGSADWLGDIAGALLRKASDPGDAAVARRLRIVDGSSISRPGSAGTDFRLHAAYEPALARFTHLELTDVHGGESFSRIPIAPGDIVLGDRAYARAPALHEVVSAGADFIVRMAWSNVRLTSLDGRLIDWNAIYGTMMPGDVCEHQVRVEYSGPGCRQRGKPLFHARLIVRRKDEEATARAAKATRRRHQKRADGKSMHPLTVATSGFLLLLTSMPADEMTAEDVWKTYRLRWQVEIAFKRLKSGLGIHRLPARDERLSRSWLMAHLIVALLIDEAVTDVLDSPPCEDDISCIRVTVAVAAA